MERYEYTFLPINIIPEEIIEEYNLRDMDKNGYVYADIRKWMYNLPQEVQIVNAFLKNKLHHVDTTSVGTHSSYGGTNLNQLLFLWYYMTLE